MYCRHLFPQSKVCPELHLIPISGMIPTMSETPNQSPWRGILDLVEWIGNKLPDPAVLFLIRAAIVMLASGRRLDRLGSPAEGG